MDGTDGTEDEWPEPGVLADEDDELGWDVDVHGRMVDEADDPDTGGVDTEGT